MMIETAAEIPLHRRAWLQTAGGGLASVALAQAGYAVVLAGRRGPRRIGRLHRWRDDFELGFARGVAGGGIEIGQ